MNTRTVFLFVIALILVAPSATAQEPGINLPGSDLRPGFALPQDDPNLCKQACENDPACKAYTYVRPGYQGPKARCWLKSAVPQRQRNDCCVSGIRETHRAPTQVTPIKQATIAGPITSTQEVNVNRPGSDLRPGFELSRDDPNLCKQACENDPACKAYTYVRPGFQGPKGRCWLKSAVPAPQRNDCCVSGVLVAPNAQTSPQREPQPTTTDRGTVSSLPVPLPAPTDEGIVSSLPLPPPSPMAADRRLAPSEVAEKVRKVSSPISRQGMLQSLSVMPGTQSELEQIAASAGTTVDELAKQPLPMTHMSETSPALINLWKNPIHIHPVLPSHEYSDGGSDYVVGTMEMYNIHADNGNCKLMELIQGGAVCVRTNDSSGADAVARVAAPLGAGSYMVAIHVDTFNSDTLDPTEFFVYIAPVMRSEIILALTPNSDGSALVGFFSIPADARVRPNPHNTMLQHESFAIVLNLPNDKLSLFGGITLSRI